MKITNAKWGPQYNSLVIKCDCKKEFQHPSGRWRVVCSKCGATDNLVHLRRKILPGDIKSSAPNVGGVQ